MGEIEVKRLRPGDVAAAKATFAMLVDVFDEDGDPPGDEYVAGLLGRDDFWALAAFLGAEVVGGLTAHTLPMTRSASAELYIYDLAVRQDHQRQGVGTRLIRELCKTAARASIYDVFLEADNEDAYVLEFYRTLGAAESPVTVFTFTTEQHPTGD